MRSQGERTVSVRQLLLQLLTELQPEIQARRVQVELDLDEVSLPASSPLPPTPRRPQMVAAIRGLLADAIESSGHEGELSVTLIDTDQAWELEFATSGRRSGGPAPTAKLENCEPGLRSQLTGLRGRNFLLSNRAAGECGGQVQFLECPQGGSARVLVIPKREIRRAA